MTKIIESIDIINNFGYNQVRLKYIEVFLELSKVYMEEKQQQTQSTQDTKKRLPRNQKVVIIVAIVALAAVLAGLTTFLIVYLSKHVDYDGADNADEFKIRDGCSDFYYNKLSKNQQKMYRMLYREAESILYGDANKNTLGVYKFSAYGISKDDAVMVWYAFRYDAPEFFIISNEYINIADSIEATIAPEFLSKKSREDALNKLSVSVEEVRQMLTGIDDEALKFKMIYDYVMSHTEYKLDSDGKDIFDGYSYSIMGVLDGDESTRSICQGYARAVSYLCNIFGIESIYVGSGSLNHALNMVEIDGEWYYADATYDDKDRGYLYFLKKSNLHWLTVCKSTGDVVSDRLISLIPTIEYGTEHDRVFKKDGLSYHMEKRSACSVVDCDPNVKNLVIPSSFYGMKVEKINCEVFNKCKNLESLTIEKDNENYSSDGNCIIEKSTNLLLFGFKNSKNPKAL